MDNQLVTKKLSAKYQTRDPLLSLNSTKVSDELEGFPIVEVCQIRREKIPRLTPFKTRHKQGSYESMSLIRVKIFHHMLIGTVSNGYRWKLLGYPNNSLLKRWVSLIDDLGENQKEIRKVHYDWWRTLQKVLHSPIYQVSKWWRGKIHHNANPKGYLW